MRNSGGAAITGLDFIGVTVFQGSCDDLQWVGYGPVDPATGVYSTSGLPAGDYILQTNMQGSSYIDGYWASGGSVIDCADAETVTVTPGETNSGKDFQLALGGVISGTVRNSGGAAITGLDFIGVTIFQGSCDNQQPVGYGPVDPATGTYSTSGLPAGDYILQTNMQGSSYIDGYWASGGSVINCADAETVTVTPGETNSGKDFQLDAGGTISGTVRDSSGAAITGLDFIGVSVFQGSCDDLQWGGYVPIDSATGTYSTSGLPAGDYILQTNTQGSSYIDEYWASGGSVIDCADAEAVTVTPGETNGGKDFQLDAGGTISGTVRDSRGSAITGLDFIDVNIFQAGCDNQQPVGYGPVDPATGTYSTSGLPAGDYILQTNMQGSSYIDEYWASGGSVIDCADAETVTVTPGETNSGKDFQLDAGGTISGTVRDSSGSAITGLDFINVGIFQGSCDSLQWVGQGSVDSATGTYSTPGLPAGDYIIQTNMQGSSYIDEYWASGGSVENCTDAESVTVSAGVDSGNKDFQLDVGSTVSGTVYQADGMTPVTGTRICVDIFAGNSCDGSTWEHVGNGCTDTADGTYVTGGLAAGEYFLFTNTFGSDYVAEYWASGGSSNNCSNAEMITVTAGQNSDNKDFQLDAGGTISGTVYQADGATPVTGTMICVDVFKNDPCDGGTWVGGGCTDSANGSYETAGLSAGTYYLSTNTFDSGYIDEYWADQASVRGCSEAQPVTVTAGQVSSGKDFQLDVGGTVSGTVYDGETKKPLTGHTDMKVEFYTGDPCGDSQYVGDVFLENDGTFHVTGVEDGAWYLRTREDSSAYVPEWHTASSSAVNCADAVLVEMKDGVDVTGIEFYLEQGARISGHVYERDGKTPISSDRDLRVQVFQGDPCGTRSWFISATTFGADGSYMTCGLADGIYYLRFKERGTDTSDDIHQREWWADPLSTPECSGAQQVIVSGTTAITGKDFQIDKAKKSFPWARFLPAILLQHAR
ncbi:MAG TPA: carboxypeptidase regulatory-like domain-containing protein [Desulfobulbus sp.]|nr:carboxypeptidase regulatory-like domain-containing protein [Desulfobulbus sp.]